jgi:hypothetical protein
MQPATTQDSMIIGKMTVNVARKCMEVAPSE